MALLNYSTAVPVEKTVNEIQKVLSKAGASSVATDYEKGAPTAIRFVIDTRFGPREFRLPANISPVTEALLEQYNYREIPKRYATAEQGAKVGWRIIKNWVEAQLAIIETEMVSLDEIMFPYMLTPTGETVYELMSRTQFALPAGRDER